MVQRRDSPSYQEAFLFCQQTWMLSAFPTGHYSTSTRPNRWTVTVSDRVIPCCVSVIHRNSISLGIERLFTLPSKSVVHFCVCVCKFVASLAPSRSRVSGPQFRGLSYLPDAPRAPEAAASHGVVASRQPPQQGVFAARILFFLLII